ncbi:MAG: hypothetical protein PHQ81_07250 [Methanofollis sp.]|nr:hypothetical protein [Methanofollis sp.]
MIIKIGQNNISYLIKIDNNYVVYQICSVPLMFSDEEAIPKLSGPHPHRLRATDDNEEIPAFSSHTHAFVAFPLAPGPPGWRWGREGREKIIKTGLNPSPLLISGGSGGRLSPPVEERAENFWKEALQFEESFNPREGRDMPEMKDLLTYPHFEKTPKRSRGGNRTMFFFIVLL